jgi:hypothetical protein
MSRERSQLGRDTERLQLDKSKKLLQLGSVSGGILLGIGKERVTTWQVQGGAMS